MGTIDDYLASLAPDDAELVRAGYAAALEIVPDAEQGTGYGMPALTHRGKPLLSIMRARGHVGVYPFSASSVETVAGMLGDVEHAKGSIRLPADVPLDAALLQALTVARRDEIER